MNDVNYCESIVKSLSKDQDEFLRRMDSMRNVNFVNIVSNRNFESATSHTNILNIRNTNNT